MADYKLNRAGFREHLLNAPFMLDEMRRRAERGKEFAETTAPVSTEPDDEQLTRYKDSFSVDVHPNGGIHHDRAEAVLSSSDPAALSIEFGHIARFNAQGQFAKANEPAVRETHVDGSYTLTKAMDVIGE